MRKIIPILITTIILTLICQFSVFAESPPHIEVTEVFSNYSNEGVDKEENFGDFLSKSYTLLKSTQSLISIVMVFVLALYVFLFKKEIPRKWGVIIPAIFIIVTFLARLTLYSKNADVYLTMMLTILQCIYFFILIYFCTKTQTITHETSLPKNSIEKKACSLIQKLINKSHYSIECIQLYSLNSSPGETYTSFQIDFIGGSSKKGININALFSTSLNIPTEYIKSMDAIQKMYTQLDIEGGITETEQDAVSALILNEIEKLKQKLNDINAVEDISVKECYLARILLIYISLYATINEHDTYIGLGRESLDLTNPSLEPILFTYERTGILGAILLNQNPYVFSYRRGGEKKGRFYYVFSCGVEKKYIVLVSMKNKNKSYYIDYHMSKNLESITQRLTTILESDYDSTKEGE